MDSKASASRIRLFREKLSLSQTAFAAGLGIPRTTLINYEKGTSVSAEMLALLMEKYQLNVHWFLTGEGEMSNSWTSGGGDHIGGEAIIPLVYSDNLIKGQAPNRESALLLRQPDSSLRPVSPAEDSDESLALAKRWGYPDDVIVYKYRKGHAEPLPIQAPDPSGTVFVPVFSQAVDAGPGQDATQLVETEEMAPVLYALCQGHHPEQCGLCRVIGDSMTDVTLFNGDWVVFDRTDIKGDGIFVISMFGEMRVKRLQYRLADRKIMIASENSKRYPDPEVVDAEVIERGELRIYGRVLGWLHRHPY